MKIYITTPMTLCIEGKTMEEIADKYWAAVPECCVSDNQYDLVAEDAKGTTNYTVEFLKAYQYVTTGEVEE